MKTSLIKHISDIFSSLQIIEAFEVYDCDVDVLPEWTKQIQVTHKYLVCCKRLSKKQKLQTFIAKSIFENELYSFWFEGDRIIEQVKNECFNEIAELKNECLKTHTRLPAYLDDLIYNQLNAEYAPDFRRFEYNLDLTKGEILKYLGTYFPRSYAESFCIFDNLFQNGDYLKVLSKKVSLNILSVGCGTGGDLIGLLTIIEKYCSFVSSINVWALDGNKDALLILEKIVEELNNQSSKTLNLKTLNIVFDSISHIDINQIDNLKFDFILSFKFVCEVIAIGKGHLDNSYYDFILKFVPMLSENGLCVLLDVTTKPEHTTYNPILMNKQANQALRELKEYKTLLPSCCSEFEKECHTNCFCQKHFTVTHSKHHKDRSKVGYRIIANNILICKLRVVDSNSKLFISNDNICPYTLNRINEEDAFVLKK